jgi:hypothetical protein
MIGISGWNIQNSILWFYKKKFVAFFAYISLCWSLFHYWCTGWCHSWGHLLNCLFLCSFHVQFRDSECWKMNLNCIWCSRQSKGRDHILGHCHTKAQYIVPNHQSLSRLCCLHLRNNILNFILVHHNY